MQCPNCRWEQEEPSSECRRCGVIFAKFRGRPSRPLVKTVDARSAFSLAADRIARIGTVPQWLIAMDDSIHPLYFAGRVGLFVILFAWGSRFILSPLESNYAGSSFLHLVNLPFHEAGHVLFMPFGRFMMVLGGTIGQLAMPLICCGTFLLQTRDPFAASVALWWTAESCMDIAPYINDARALELTLLGGMTGQEVEGHDWEYLLRVVGWLRYDHAVAHLAQWIGIGLMVLALFWGGALLIRQSRHVRR